MDRDGIEGIRVANVPKTKRDALFTGATRNAAFNCRIKLLPCYQNVRQQPL